MNKQVLTHFLRVLQLTEKMFDARRQHSPASITGPQLSCVLFTVTLKYLEPYKRRQLRFWWQVLIKYCLVLRRRPFTHGGIAPRRSDCCYNFSFFFFMRCFWKLFSFFFGTMLEEFGPLPVLWFSVHGKPLQKKKKKRHSIDFCVLRLRRSRRSCFITRRDDI